jgi:hypothetical protein
MDLLEKQLYKFIKSKDCVYETTIHNNFHTDESLLHYSETATALLKLTRKRKIDLTVDKQGNRIYSSIRNLQ